MFAIVKNMNVAFGNSEGNPDALNWEKIEKQVSNILSEFIEAYKAMGIELKVAVTTVSRDPSKRDVDGLRDALCDINVFSLGAHHLMGYDAERDMQSVIGGVMTRFCKNMTEMAQTLEKYRALGVELYPEGNFPTLCLKSARDQQMPEYPKGKFVKCINYKQPVFYKHVPASVEPQVHTFIKPSENIYHPLRRSTDGITEEMAALRTAHMAKQKEARENIEGQVAKLRENLEREAFGEPGEQKFTPIEPAPATVALPQTV